MPYPFCAALLLFISLPHLILPPPHPFLPPSQVPYVCAVPLVFQSFQEWQNSELGLHPIQVALQVSLPEIDGAIEPIIFAGREGTLNNQSVCSHLH